MHVFAFFLRSFKTKKNLLSFSKDKVFNFWLSKVKFFILHEGGFFSLCVCYYISSCEPQDEDFKTCRCWS